MPTEPRTPAINPKRRELWERFEGKCADCGKGTFLISRVDGESNDRLATVDHILPRTKGGNRERGNIQLLCQACNVKKGRSIPEFAVPGTSIWLQKQRELLGMTQTELAAALKLDRGTISKYERGANRPMWGLLELSIRALHAGMRCEGVK